MKINILNILTLILTSALISCSSDDIPTDTSETRVPITLHYSGMVSAEVMANSRVASAATLDHPMLPGTEIGLFILHEKDYEDMINEEYSDRTYGYTNIRGVLKADGSIDIPDTTLYYPLAKDARVAIIAYAPYNAELIADSRILKGHVSISDDQSSEADVMNSDLLIGAPLASNPIRSSSGNTPIDLQFRHALTMVELTVDVEASALSLCSSIDVEMTNCPTGIYNNMITGAWGETTSTGNVKIASFPGIKMANLSPSKDHFTYTCSAIALPYTFDDTQKPQFTITFRNSAANSGADLVEVRTDDETPEYLAGKVVRYHTTVSFGSPSDPLLQR